MCFLMKLVLLAICFQNALAVGLWRSTSKQQGLYDPSDAVISLTPDNFDETVFNRPQATFTEFYRSDCSHCNHFAPIWKATAKSIEPWKRVVRCAAVDCRNDDNEEICRKNEIHSVPRMRYFPPNYENQLGVDIDHLLVPDMEMPELVNMITEFVVNETNGDENWPEFERFKGPQWSNAFDGVPASVKFAYIVTDALPDFLPEQVALDHMELETAVVKILDSANTKLITEPLFRLGFVNRGGTYTSLSVFNDSREAYAKSIHDHLINHLDVSTTTTSSASELENSTESPANLRDKYFYFQAMLMKPMPLFRADLEQAIQESLGYEVLQHEVISGESLAALRSFVSVLSRYYDFGNRASYMKLLEFLLEPSLKEIRSSDLKSFINKLNPPIFRKSRYIGCYSLQPNKRRYPCSLWSLFHHLTIQHLESNENNPIEVLNAIYSYVKHFFSCSECSKHFQEMSEKYDIWSITSKEQAAFWLWSLHNEVNQRLAGDITEDCNHPKVQFPAKNDCPQCYDGDEYFNPAEVLAYLRQHYGNDHVNDMGLEQSYQMGPKLALKEIVVKHVDHYYYD